MQIVPKIRRQFRHRSVYPVLGDPRKRRIGACLLLSFTLFLLPLGCFRDSNTKKLKYLESRQSYYDHGKFREAFIQFSNAVQIDEGYAEAHYQLAQSCIRLQKWEQAYVELRRTIELEPNNPNPRIDLANLLIAGGQLKEAKEQTDFVFGLEPNNAMVHLTSADLLTAEGDLQAAVSELQRAIALAPNRWEPYLALAQLEVRLNQPAVAEANFRMAVELDGKTAAAALALTNYYSETGQFQGAEQEITDAVRVHPDNPELRATLVRVYMSEGKEPEADSAAKAARDRLSDNSSGCRMLGDLASFASASASWKWPCFVREKARMAYPSGRTGSRRTSSDAACSSVCRSPSRIADFAGASWASVRSGRRRTAFRQERTASAELPV